MKADKANPTVMWYEVLKSYVVYRSRGKGRTKKRAKRLWKTIWKSRHKDSRVLV